MKSIQNLFLFACFFLIINKAHAQGKNKMTLNPYNYSDPGRYLSLEYDRDLKKDFQFNVGVIVHYNRNKNNPDRHQEYFLHHRFRAYKFSDFIGLSLGGQKNIYCFSPRSIHFFIYNQLLLRNIGARSMRFQPIDTIVVFNNNTGFNDTIENSVTNYTNLHNLFSAENITGLGLSANISKRISLNMKLGVGFNIVFNLPKPLFNSSTIIEYSIQQSIGISYSF